MHNDYNTAARTADVRLLTDAEVHAVNGGVTNSDYSALDIISVLAAVAVGLGLWDWLFG